jgi:hypothetical protein
VFADAVISINVGELNITWVHVTAVVGAVFAGLTGISNKVINYLRDRDAREAALRQQIFEMAMATARAEEKAAASVQSLAEKVK